MLLVQIATNFRIDYAVIDNSNKRYIYIAKHNLENPTGIVMLKKLWIQDRRT